MTSVCAHGWATIFKFSSIPNAPELLRWGGRNHWRLAMHAVSHRNLGKYMLVWRKSWPSVAREFELGSKTDVRILLLFYCSVLRLHWTELFDVSGCYRTTGGRNLSGSLQYVTPFCLFPFNPSFIASFLGGANEASTEKWDSCTVYLSSKTSFLFIFFIFSLYS